MEKYREYLSELNDMLLRSGVDLELEKQIEEGTLEIPVLVLEQYLEFNKSLAISDSGQAIKVASGTGNMLYNNILYEQLKGEYEETVKNALALLYSEAVDDNPMSEEEKFQARIDAFNEYLQENKELEEQELRVDEEETPSNLVPFDKTQRYTGLTYTVDSIIEGTSQGTDLSYDEINAQNGVGGYDDTVYTEIVEDTDDDLVSDLDILLEDEEEQGTEATEDSSEGSEDSEDEDYDDSIYTGEEDEDDSSEDSEDEDDSLEDEDFSLEDDDDSSEDADDSLEDDEEDYADYDNLLEDDDTSSEDEDDDYADYDNLLEDDDSSSEDEDDEDESSFDIPEVVSEEEGYSDDEDESAFDLPEVDEEDEGYSEDDDDDSLDDYTYQEEDTDSEEDEDDEDESAFDLPEVDDEPDEDAEADEDDDESSFDLPDVDDDDSEEDYDEDFDDLDSFGIDDDSDGSEVASPPDPPVPASQSITKGTKPQIKKDSNDYFADAILGVNDKVIKIPGWFRNKNTQRK